jgi:hypothetical protein
LRNEDNQRIPALEGAALEELHWGAPTFPYRQGACLLCSGGSHYLYLPKLLARPTLLKRQAQRKVVSALLPRHADMQETSMKNCFPATISTDNQFHSLTKTSSVSNFPFLVYMGPLQVGLSNFIVMLP